MNFASLKHNKDEDIPALEPGKSGSKNLTLVLAAIAILVIGAGAWVYQRIAAGRTAAPDQVQEVDLPFDPDGPYALLFPRRDGNALVLDLNRTASYDKISYELAYVSLPETVVASGEDEVASGSATGIDRGVLGNISTSEKKGEYKQEILFGTCSKNICKYDQGVENGTLTLHIKKGGQAYRMVTQWHLQKPSVALGVLTSGDGHLTYKVNTNATDLDLVGFTIINDLSGAPKLPNDRQVVGKVYAVNPPEAVYLNGGEVKIELADNPPAGSKIAIWKDAQNKWQEYDTQISGSALTAKVDASGIITVLAPK